MSEPGARITAAGARSMAVGEVVNSVLNTGDGTVIVVQVTPEAAAAVPAVAEAVLRRTDRPSATTRGRRYPSYRRRDRPDHVDREDEARALLAHPGATVLSGPKDIGKTYVAWHALDAYAPAIPDGIVRVRAPEPDLDDLEHELFCLFWQTNEDERLARALLERDLAGIRAVIVLEDFQSPEDVDGHRRLSTSDLEKVALELADVLPESHLIFVSREQLLPSTARHVALGGLTGEDALALVQVGLGRALRDDEREPARLLCATLDGHPGRIREAVRTAEAARRSLAQEAELLEKLRPAEALAAQQAQELSPDEFAVLQYVGAFGDTPIGDRRIAAAGGRVDAPAILRRSEQRGHVESHSPRYSLTGSLAEHPPDDWDLRRPREGLLDEYLAWIAGDPPMHERLNEHAALERMMRFASQQGRHRDAIALGQALSEALFAGRRFGAWGVAIRGVHDAATALGDDGAVAWALHQEGTRKWCLEQGREGVPELQQALRLRRDILRDEPAARRTEQNLRTILGPPPPSALLRLVRSPLVLLLVLVLVGGSLAVAIAGRDSDPSGGGGGATASTDHELTVRVRGDGVVSIAHGSKDHRCRSTCHERVPAGRMATLRVVEGDLQRWSGACRRTGSCEVQMNRDERVTAQFAPLAVPGEHTVTVKRVGLGPGSITSDIDGIDCPEDCTESYADGTRLELTASTESGTFEGWGVDACDDEELTCEIELIQDIQLAPRFMAKPGQGPDRTLKVTLDGTGSGSVTSEDGGIDCPNDCKATFADGTRVQLTASQGNDSTFEGWGNDACDDEERTCEVELTEDVELRPVFADSEPSNPRLTVTVSLPGVSDETAQIYPDVSTTVTASVTIGTSAGQPCTVSATNAERLKGTQSTRCPYDVSEGTAVAVAPAFRSYVISWPSCPAGKPSGSSSSCAFTMPARDEAVSVLLDRGPG